MGKYLKSTSGWDNYNGASGNGTDDYGFDAMPAGYASYGSYTTKGIGQYADFWTSSEYSSQAANYMEMRYKDGRLYSLDARKDNAFSVRCIKNK